MTLLGHILSELRWQNRASRTRTAPRSKTSGPGTAPTKKRYAEAPFQKVKVALTRATPAGQLRRVASCGARDAMPCAKRVSIEVAKRCRLESCELSASVCSDPGMTSMHQSHSW